MRSTRIAEWILELSMTRERAESIAGDFREAGRSSFWFWRSVLATMSASVWSDFRSEWWKMAAAALVINATWFVVEVDFLDLILAQGVLGPEAVQRYERLNIALVWAQMFFGPFWVARLFPGREIASWFAGTLALAAVALAAI